MTFRTLSAHSAARDSIVSTNSYRARALMMGLLLSSVSTVAVAQDAQPTTPPVVTVAPGSTTAQSTEQTTQPNPGPTPPAPQADDVARPQSGSTVIENAPQAPQDQGLGAIIVTATKRETNLQKTPIAISVANTQALTDRHAGDLLSLGDGSIPSLRVATFEARQSALTVGIRGIVPGDQNQTAREPGVGVYLDGVYLGRSQGLNSSLLDIERIEVLKGPQGTLFGRNTEGGAVSIITRAPTGVFGVRGTMGVGNYGQYQGIIHVDLPAVANVAIKVDALINHQDATVKNPLAGQTGWNYHNTVGGRVAGRWTPIDGLTIDVAYDRTKDESTPNFSQLINYNPKNLPVGTYVGRQLTFNGANCTNGVQCIAPLSPLIVVSGDNRQAASEIGVPQQPSTDWTHGTTGTVKYKVSPNLELRSITAWRSVVTKQWDANGPHRTIFQPNTPFSRYSLSELFQNQFSQEFQLVGNVAKQLDYVLGAYYFVERATEAAATPSTDFWNANGTGYTILSENGNGVPQPPYNCGTSGSTTLINGVAVPVQGWDRPNWCVQRHSHAHARSLGVFGQATWTPPGFDIFHLTVGARYTKDKRTGVLDVVNGNVINVGGTPGAAVLATPFTFNYSKGRVDPLVIAAIDATSDIHLYAKYSTGYRSGGANDRSATFRSFGPETVTSYEVGGKMDFLDHLARLNLAAYYMRRKGTQTDFDFVDTNPNSPSFNLHTEETLNSPGISKIKGIEADLTVRPIQALTLGASYAYTDVNVPPIPYPFPGATFGTLTQVFTVYTPKHAVAGYADVEVPSGFSTGKWRFHIDANYASRQYSFQSENVLTDPNFSVNARVALADIEMNQGSTLMTFALWARNLTNNTYIYRRSAANARTLGDYGNFNPPRLWGAEMSFKIGAPRIAPPTYVPPPAPPPPATVTCESGTVITAPGVCPPPAAPPPPPPPPPAPERGS
jgi:iron complex outermembrane receptor protein